MATLLEEPHVVLVPYPSQGHITPFMELGKLLHSRGFHITLVNTEFNHKRLLRASGLEALNAYRGFKFETIPDGLPPSDRDATQDVPSLCVATRKNLFGPFIDLVKNKLNSSSSSPTVTCIIADGVMSFATKAAKELGILAVRFWTASACSFIGYLQFREVINRGLVPVSKDEDFLVNLDEVLDWVPGMKNIRFRDLPSFIGTSNPEDDIMFNFMGGEAQSCLNESSIIFNTFDNLEQEVLDAVSSIFPGSIYTIGPIAMLIKQEQIPIEGQLKSMRSNLWKEDSNCLSWLGEREPNSVIYVNFGSITVMTDEQLKEFSWGLANSRFNFLWIIRPDVVMGDSVGLPEELVAEIKDRGYIASWCPQDKVLSHPSIAGFLTHCGWNSMLESLYNGVPIICWPFFADQQTNCRFACEIWEAGMEIDNDVKREEIEALLRELMEGAKGKKMKENAMKWKAKAEHATKMGGTSYNNFGKWVKDMLGPIPLT
ncbi:linamarin synthase 1-like [Papaver somniferum]|uniref:linamarin synthase 1-like n=1 Tax=Papaver somniferum TaxID=3469 RepID=UPI000E7033A5|nr:linamarin synthase 1-like [Papaver somniferum]